VNPLIDLLPTDGWQRLAVDSLWQSTLVGLLGLASARFIARRPATRAMVSLCAIVAAIAIPLVSAGARLAGWGMLKPAAVAPPVQTQRAASPTRSLNEVITAYGLTETQQDAPEAIRIIDSTTEAPFQTAPLLSDNIATKIDASAVLLPIWSVLSVALLVRLLTSVLQTRRLLRGATPCDDRMITAALHAAAERMRIAAPRVLSSRAVTMPTVFAFGRGMVLVPASEPSSLSVASTATDERTIATDRWFAIFCHELGHVRRRDGWNRLAAEISLVALPWQPLMWLLRREFLRHAEEACDDWALANGVHPIDFASVLTDFIPAVPRLSLGATIMSTDAKTRILRLLALRETPRPRTTWPQLAAIAISAFVVVASVALAQRSPIDKEVQSESIQTKGAATSSLNNPKPAKRAATATDDFKLEPPDVVTIDVLRLIPKEPYRIRAVDILHVDLEGARPGQEIRNILFVVEPGGFLNLGATYGKVKVAGLSLDEARDAVEAHLRRTLTSPQVSLSLKESFGAQQIAGRRTVGPDGYLNLGAFGQVHVDGMTLREAREAIEKKLSDYFEKPAVSLAPDAHTRLQRANKRGRATTDSKPVYVLEPPDVIVIDPIRLFPKGRQRIERLDQLEIAVLGTPDNAPIKGAYQVDADGEISLGPAYGRLQVAGLTVKEAIEKLEEHLSRTLSAPAVALRITDKSKNQQVAGTHLIGPDGHVNLGTFGQVYVAGMSIDEARGAIEAKLSGHFDKPSVAVKVLAYNSKVYYLIVEGDGKEDNIHRFPITGNETVLDALAQANAAIRKDMSVWIARPSPGDGGTFQILPVNYDDITGKGATATNYQILPGDRVFLKRGDGKPASADTK
jgi:polysaccharide export outer membrane protein